MGITLPAGAQAAQGFCIIGGALYYTGDNGTTWTEVLAPGTPSNSAAPVSGNGTVGTPFTIAAGALPLTAIAAQAANPLLANGRGGRASPTAITAAAAAALLPAATSSTAGLLPAGLFANTQGAV